MEKLLKNDRKIHQNTEGRWTTARVQEPRLVAQFPREALAQQESLAQQEFLREALAQQESLAQQEFLREALALSA